MVKHNGLDGLSGLIAFARAASLGSYTAAARSLSVSPSAVSKSIRRLEERLGVTLFNRTTRSLTLTPEGIDLHDRVLRLLKELEQIEQAAMAAHSGPKGVLRVTAPLPIGVRVLAPVLPRFRERYPNVSIDLRLTDHLVDLVREGVDVAIRVGELSDSQLISRRLGTHRLCAFASPGYLKKRGTPGHPDELANHDCINFRYQSTGQALKWPFRHGRRTEEIKVNAGITIDVSDAVMAVLVAGGGIGIAATYVAHSHVLRGELVPILTRFAVDRFPILALWPESRRGSPNVRAFVDFLTEVFPDPAPWDSALTLKS